MTTEKNEEAVVIPPADETAKNEVELKDIADQAVAIAEEAAKQLDKANSDKENYKQGMLVKDRQLKSLRDQGVDVGEEERITVEEVEEIVEKKLSSKKEVETEVQALIKKVAELKTALVNRQGLPSTPTGNSTEGTAEVKPSRWVDAPEVKQRLLDRGLDPEKVFANWKALQSA